MLLMSVREWLFDVPDAKPNPKPECSETVLSQSEPFLAALINFETSANTGKRISIISRTRFVASLVTNMKRQANLRASYISTNQTQHSASGCLTTAQSNQIANRRVRDNFQVHGISERRDTNAALVMKRH